MHLLFRHSREGGKPENGAENGYCALDRRLRGDDGLAAYATYGMEYFLNVLPIECRIVI